MPTAQFSASPDLHNEFLFAVIGAMDSSADLSAPIPEQPHAVIALIWSTSTSIPIAWSVLGLLDFIGTVGTAFLASQALAVVHTDPPTSVFTHWPMVLFPVYLVPFSIILHITTIRVPQACAG